MRHCSLKLIGQNLIAVESAIISSCAVTQQ